jgi:AraC-like DNA-binding protein
VSTRSLARVFAERGTTIMRGVFDERIGQAMKLPASTQAAHRSITEIAFACGFSDSSHFGASVPAALDCAAGAAFCVRTMSCTQARCFVPG